MQVQTGLEIVGVELGEELIGIGEQQIVPAIAGPAFGVIARVHDAEFHAEGGMPVHVDDEDVEGDVVLVEAADDLLDLLVGVCPVARPPGAEGEARRQRDAAGYFDVVAQRALVIVRVAEEVPILAVARGAFDDPGPRAVLTLPEAEVGRVEKGARRIVDYGPPRPRDQALFHRLLGLIAGCTVERARGAHQVLVVDHAGPPDREPVAHVQIDGQVFRREAAVLFGLVTGVRCVDQGERGGAYRELVPVF